MPTNSYKQQLEEITNNAENNQNAIKNYIVSAVNSKSNTNLPNNISWNDIGNAINNIILSAGDAETEDVLIGKTFSNKDNNNLVGTMDLKPENIKEGITYADITGNLKEKITNIDFIYNIPSGYRIKQYIPNEGIYCENNVLGKVYLFSEDGTLVKTITSNIANADLPMDIIKDKIVWSRNGTYGNVFITDKEGVLINQFTTSSTLSLLIFSFTGDKIYMLSYSGGTAPKLIYIYDTSGTLLITSEANFHDGCLLFKAYKNNKLVCVCSTGKYIIDDTDGSYYPISIVYPMSIF